MVDRLDLWSAFDRVGDWWLDAMILVWVIFAVMLFVAEPPFLHRWLAARAPERNFTLVPRLHWALRILSLVTI
jgi:hypothetical protein